jgi:hypothetical protein
MMVKIYKIFKSMYIGWISVQSTSLIKMSNVIDLVFQMLKFWLY